MSGRRTSTERGPWTATRPVASDWSSRTARAPARRSARASETTCGVAGVGDDHEPVLGEAIDDQVVDDAAVGRTDHRVVGAPDGERRRVRDQRAGKRRCRPRALDEQLAHVREVEQADPLADRAMLLEDRRVLDRHPPAGELDHPGAEAGVPVGQRRVVDGLRLDGGVGHEAASAALRLPDAASTLAAPTPSSSAAWATSARSVSKVSIAAASPKSIQRTWSNS